MEKLGIGIIGPSDVAYRKFLPALSHSDNFDFIGMAVADISERALFSNKTVTEADIVKSRIKASNMILEFGGKIFNRYLDIIESEEVHAVYIPLPPIMHYYWAKKALENGKHVLLEKPFTENHNKTKKLVKLAQDNNLAIHENYAFCFHNQVEILLKLINDKSIGEIRQIRSAFGFPHRGVSDFRYEKSMGGGALLDCGGYPIKLASKILGNSVKVTTSSLCCLEENGVDIFGSVTLENDNHITAQLAFGMDNYYKCELEIWGSKGVLYAPRIFTAPSDMKVEIQIKNDENNILIVDSCDQFLGSINYFFECINSETLRNKAYEEIIVQSELINSITTKKTY